MSENKEIDFRTAGYFPGHIIFLGLFLLTVALPLFFINLMGALVLCLVSLVIFTTHYRLQVDLQNKTYHDYLWILGFRKGEKGKFNSIEYLFIKKNRASETMQLKVASTIIHKEVFDGYLKFSEQDKIHLLTMDSKAGLIKKLTQFALILNVGIIDYSEGKAVELVTKK